MLKDGHRFILKPFLSHHPHACSLPSSDKVLSTLTFYQGLKCEMGDRLEDITQNAAQRDNERKAQRLKRHGGQEMGQRWHLKKQRLVIS